MEIFCLVKTSFSRNPDSLLLCKKSNASSLRHQRIFLHFGITDELSIQLQFSVANFTNFLSSDQYLPNISKLPCISWQHWYFDYSYSTVTKFVLVTPPCIMNATPIDCSYQVASLVSRETEKNRCKYNQAKWGGSNMRNQRRVSCKRAHPENQ